MKKILMSLMLVFTLTSVSNAQALLMLLFGDKLSTETFQMGINVAGTASDIGGITDANLRYSWAFGAFGEVRFSDDWFLHFNLTAKTPGGAKNIQPFEDIIPEIDTLTTDISVTRSFNYITLPIFIKYSLGSFKLGLGGQLGYLTSATDIYTGFTFRGDDLNMERNVREKMNLWDAGVTGIIDYFFKPEANMKSMRISLTYYYGLIDILKDNTGDAWNNSILMLSLAIPMGGGDDVDEIEK
ncbi:MAG: outer membrane beta-barrel protein [Bacteroidetes bacterium]|nr:outer membrane beta-barrel protein [Bacteroidota bacterium]